MAETPSMHKCVFVLALIACHTILSAEGRQLKYTEKESSTKKETQRESAKQGNNSINLHQNAAGHKEDFQPTQPRAENTVAGKKEILPPISFGDLAAAFKDDFRPTVPGFSPGVGHIYAEHEKDVESKAPDDYNLSAGHSVTGYKEDFRPTEPGHIPGVAHVLSNKSPEPKHKRVHVQQTH